MNKKINHSWRRISEYLKIKDAARFLGVTTNTLRNWGRDEKIKTYRHPTSKYRLYLEEDLEEFLEEIKNSAEGE